MTRRRLTIALAAVGVYLASVVLANWLTSRYGFVPVGFGQAATAGTFAAGGALVVRDLVQDAAGRIGVLLLIAVAAGLSWLVAKHSIAAASAAAFAWAELVDMGVYSPLRCRAERFGDARWARAVAVAAALGAVVDTVVFLRIAFGWSAVGPALPGQLIGKAEVVAVLILLGWWSRAVLRESLDAAGA